MDDRHSSRQMIATLVFILTGPILWAADLTAIYGAQSALCAWETLPQPTIGWLVVATSSLLILAAIIAAAKPRPFFTTLVGAPPHDQWDFMQGAMRVLCGLSVLAILYFALAALMLPACGNLR